MKKIIVVQAGWVVIGEVSYHGDIVRVEDASVIRVWGTTAGLGEIALKGITKDTILDAAGVIEVYTHAVIMQIDCVV
jgi:hypothetical protein